MTSFSLPSSCACYRGATPCPDSPSLRCGCLYSPGHKRRRHWEKRGPTQGPRTPALYCPGKQLPFFLPVLLSATEVITHAQVPLWPIDIIKIGRIGRGGVQPRIPRLFTVPANNKILISQVLIVPAIGGYQPPGDNPQPDQTYPQLPTPSFRSLLSRQTMGFHLPGINPRGTNPQPETGTTHPSTS